MEKVKKQLLQASINYGTMPMDTLKGILSALCDLYEVHQLDEMNAINAIIVEIDTQIRKYDQTLQFIKHPLNGQEYLVFALLLTNQACKFQPNYTDTERKYFYKLLETLASSEDYGIEWNNIYAVASQLPVNAQHPLSKERIQELENIWVSQGYFLALEDKIYFGPRTMLEYGKYLKNNFSDVINDCVLCNNIVYWDVKCSECEVKLHRNCIRKYLIKKSTCPSCKKTWNTRLSL
ncbi:non-structural maintenance of chromosomes element 1 homolog isoform X1 [Calliphora vicina]|uniref:non-structural maintenance of chromosomes element 1 homolog isoform X1 n=1 Tax=Calliphora vicina TaxID=7373 RepID=UPI00325A9969